MKLLVTGGLGFIGSNFINYWLKANPNDTVVNLDKMTYAADIRNLNVAIEYGHTLVKGDISDKDLTDRLVKDADMVINFAAETHVDRSIDNSTNFIQSNVVGVHSLLEAIRKYNIRYHQVSTDEVYGSLDYHSTQRFTENSRYNPRNPYSASKAAADHLVNAYYNTYSLPVTISNCGNNYGPNQYPEKLIPKTIMNALENKKIPIYGKGTQIRDWIYVEDHCKALELILKKGKSGETYLISSEEEKRNVDVVKGILKQLGKDKGLITFVEDRPGHDLRYSMDPSKIKRELKWKKRVSFSEGIAKTIDHYRDNTERYKNKLKD